MHLVGFVIRIYHDGRSSECQILERVTLFVLEYVTGSFTRYGRGIMESRGLGKKIESTTLAFSNNTLKCDMK